MGKYVTLESELTGEGSEVCHYEVKELSLFYYQH